MENRNVNELDELIEKFKQGRVRIIQGAAGKALTFFKNSFRNQGFTDQTLEKWKERSGGVRNNGRGVLMDRGVLRRGLKIFRADGRGALIGIDESIKYADIHNEGGEIPITANMRRFFWAMYYKSGGGKGIDPEDLPEQARFWFAMALNKEGKIIIPKRKFIGDSKTLEMQLIAYFEKEVTKLFDVE